MTFWATRLSSGVDHTGITSSSTKVVVVAGGGQNRAFRSHEKLLWVEMSWRSLQLKSIELNKLKGNGKFQKKKHVLCHLNYAR